MLIRTMILDGHGVILRVRPYWLMLWHCKVWLKKKSDSYEVILIRDNYLQEGCASAVFIEKIGHIFTPPLTSYILPSITREVVVKCAKKADIKLIEQNIMQEEMYQADNLWVASTTKELSPIIELDGHQIGQGAPSERWHKLIQQLYREYDSD